MQRARHPSVWQVGRVVDTGTYVVVAGWGLGLCAAGCDCHRHPQTKQLVIHPDEARGRLGLRSFRAGCTCCVPWTALELAGVLKDLADIAALQGPAAPQTSA